MATTNLSTHTTSRLLILLTLFLTFAQALPVDVLFSRELEPRQRAILRNDTGLPKVFTPSGETVPQGPASDGAGSGYDAPAVLWIVFNIIVGAPLALAGIRGWRLTTGAGVGLSLSVSTYAALVNSVDEKGVPDIALTMITFAFFGLGFGVGSFRFAKFSGLVLLGVCGGLSVGMRVVMSLPGLIFDAPSQYVVNWAITAVFGLMGGILILWKQRLGILIGTTSCGTFLGGLAVDLIVSKQDGLSRGLRFLIDRNPSHVVDILEAGYRPTMTTRIIMWVSLGVIPVLAIAQHFIFRDAFDRTPQPDDSELQINYPDEKAEAPRPLTQGFLSNLWENSVGKNASPNRFSLDSLAIFNRSR